MMSDDEAKEKCRQTLSNEGYGDCDIVEEKIHNNLPNYDFRMKMYSARFVKK